MLQGTFKLYGDFDECKSIERVKSMFDDRYFSPKSCYIGIVRGSRPPFDLESQAFQPYFASFLASFCVPDSCSTEDIDNIANATLNRFGLAARQGTTYCQLETSQVPYTDWAIASL